MLGFYFCLLLSSFSFVCHASEKSFEAIDKNLLEKAHFHFTFKSYYERFLQQVIHYPSDFDSEGLLRPYLEQILEKYENLDALLAARKFDEFYQGIDLPRQDRVSKQSVAVEEEFQNKIREAELWYETARDEFHRDYELSGKDILYSNCPSDMVFSANSITDFTCWSVKKEIIQECHRLLSTKQLNKFVSYYLPYKNIAWHVENKKRLQRLIVENHPSKDFFIHFLKHYYYCY